MSVIYDHEVALVEILPNTQCDRALQIEQKIAPSTKSSTVGYFAY